MKLTIDKHDKNSIEFTIDAPVEYANAVRRTIMCDLPTEALHCITVHENTSCLDNDMLEQRLVLIPTKQGQKTKFEYQTLNETEESVSIYSHDLSKELVEDILVVVLRPNEKLHLECSSQQGIGSMNAKWSCTTDMKYKQHRRLIGNLTDEELIKIQSIIPQFKLKQLTMFIDTNLIFMINQICGREVYSQELHDVFTISFTTIDQSDAKERLLQCLKQLIQRTLHLELKNDQIITNDYSIPNLLMLEHDDKDFTCIKQHNLDEYFKLSQLQDLDVIQNRIAHKFRELLISLEE